MPDPRILAMMMGGKPQPEPTNTTTENVPITNQHRQDWNNYVDWLDKKGMKGSPELDKNGLGQQMINQYRKEVPATTVSNDMVTPIQKEFSNYRDWSLDQIKQKKAVLDPGVTPENYMKSLSIIDGIPGQRTTSFKFPPAYMKTLYNGNLTGKDNLGFAQKSSVYSLLK